MTARVQTLDHCGFVVEDILRAHEFYGQVFGAKPLHMSNLKTRTYTGWAIISFVQMGKHRFELCLAHRPLPSVDRDRPTPRVGFRVTEDELQELRRQLDEAGVEYEGPINHPEAIPLNQTVRVYDPDGNVLDFSTHRERKVS